MWRFDLTKLEDVKASAAVIYQHISSNSMPPPPFPALAKTQISQFKTWMDSGFGSVASFKRRHVCRRASVVRSYAAKSKRLSMN